MSQTCAHAHTVGVVPHGGKYDLVKEVVVQPLGHFQARPLHSHRGGKTEDDAKATEHAEHGQIPRVAEATVLQQRDTSINSMAVTL